MRPDCRASLGEALAACKLLDDAQVRRWVERAVGERVSLEALLEREKVLSRKQLLRALENHWFRPGIDVREVAYDPALLKLVPERIAKRHLVLVTALEGENYLVAFARPDDEHALEAVARALQKPFETLVALPGDLVTAIDERYARLAEQVRMGSEPRAATAGRPGRAFGGAVRPESPEAGPAAPPPPEVSLAARLALHKTNATAIVDEILAAACKLDVTDIHLQPEQDGLHVRFRADGILHPMAMLPESVAPAIASRFKILAQMDIAERRLPQDGRFTTRDGGKLVDLRISSLPSRFGEKIVARLLKKDMSLLDLENLRMPPEVALLHKGMIESSSGFVLVTGPTGSGKTTTLYATLSSLDRRSQNIVTIEDPIEYSLSGMTQVQISEAAGLTFELCLQSILRQDPDVVLVGEIRNSETLEIASRAALTGHKVFSTLHTNDATQAIARLLDMGCIPYMITSTVRGVLAQRLVRTICEDCREEYEPNETELAILGAAAGRKLERGRGCARCAMTGYRGRRALFEYFDLKEKYHRLVLDRASSYAIRNAARRDGMITLAQYAKRAVLEGMTTVAEIQRCILSDDDREQLCHGCQRAVSSEYAVCPFCKTVLHESCQHCGHPVDTNWEACAHCGHEIEREWKRAYCTNCDAPQEPGWNACPYCGRGRAS